MPFYERQPFVQSLIELMRELLSGEIRVPRFQRPGTQDTWSPKQRAELLDSIHKGFPVGTILVWASDLEIPSLDVVGGYRVPAQKPGVRQRYLLDGHQRLSTVAWVLGAGVKLSGLQPDVISDEIWFYDFGDVSEDVEPGFVWRASNSPTPTPSDRYIPLANILDRVWFNSWVRSSAINDETAATAERLRDQLREYQMPVAVLAAETLEQATESFKRVNSSGTPMSDFHMVTALTYTSGFHLNDVVETCKDEVLAGSNWAGVDNELILAVCRLRLGLNPAKRDAADTARKLGQSRDIVRQAVVGILHASRAFATVGVLGPKAVPYDPQVILAAAVAVDRQDDPDFMTSFEGWFWATTYGEFFAVSNSAVMSAGRRALETGSREPLERYLPNAIGPIDRFDFRAARSKALALLLARAWDRDNELGGSASALANEGSEAVVTLRPRLPRVPENLMVVPRNVVPEVRAALTGESFGLLLGPESLPENWRKRLFIGGGPDDERERRAVLRKAEGEFVQKQGLTWRERP
ncbi:MAG: DUF262 domain-containing protein [Myxococcales bacterium]|nr:DUF262 domain-containing protein [Myxococcales bacterium]